MAGINNIECNRNLNIMAKQKKTYIKKTKVKDAEEKVIEQKKELENVQLAKVRIDVSGFEKAKVTSVRNKNDLNLSLKPKYLQLCKKIGVKEVDSYLGYSDEIKALSFEKVEILNKELKDLFIEFAEIYGIDKLKSNLK